MNDQYAVSFEALNKILQVLTKEMCLSPLHVLPRDMELFGSFGFDREELSTTR